MNVEVLLTEAEIADEFAESIEARDLPEKFFYWTPLSVASWKDLAARSDEAFRETWGSLGAKAAALVSGFPGRVPVISFGSGDGLKDREILKALKAAGRDVKYYPVDASQSMLELACSGAEDDDCEAYGIKADISSPVHLMLAADVAEAPRLFLMVGNTLGGFDPLDQIKEVGNCLKKGDILVIDANIHAGDIEPSDEQKRFVFAPLASFGIKPEDGELQFATKPDDRLDGLFITTRRFQAARDLTIRAAAREISLGRGERILLNFRYLMTPEAFRWLLTEQAGLRVATEIPSTDGRFVTAVCIKA